MSTYVIVVYSARSGTSSKKVYSKLENICKKHTDHLRDDIDLFFLMSDDGIITTKPPFIFFFVQVKYSMFDRNKKQNHEEKVGFLLFSIFL